MADNARSSDCNLPHRYRVRRGLRVLVRSEGVEDWHPHVMQKTITGELAGLESGVVIVKHGDWLIKVNARFVKRLDPKSHL